MRLNSWHIGKIYWIHYFTWVSKIYCIIKCIYLLILDKILIWLLGVFIIDIINLICVAFWIYLFNFNFVKSSCQFLLKLLSIKLLAAKINPQFFHISISFLLKGAEWKPECKLVIFSHTLHIVSNNLYSLLFFLGNLFCTV